MKTMNAEELQHIVDGEEEVYIVDVREVDEVAAGKIPGAINVPLSELAERYEELEKDKEYVLVCAAGGRSAKAQMFLEAQGFDCINMVDGMKGWTGKVE